MRFFILNLFLFCLNICIYSQHQISGQVLNDDTKNPLIYCTVQVENKSKGTYTNESGLFKLETTGYGNQKIIFSHVGYVNDTIKIRDFKEKTAIYLKPDINQLGEVVINSINKNKNIDRKQNWFWNRNRERKYMVTPARGTTYGILIDKPNEIFGSFELYYLKQKNQPLNKIRIHFYKRAENGEPTKEKFFKKDLIFELPYKSKKLRVDLSYLNFKIPKNGFYLGIEFMGSRTNKLNSETTIFYTDDLKGYRTYIKTWGNDWLNTSKYTSRRSKYYNLKYSYSILK